MDQTSKSVRSLYETFPYPPRSNNAHASLLSFPSFLPAINHHVFGGCFDFSRGFRALVAGGGTGDALITLGLPLKRMGIPYELAYLDLSSRSRDIAQRRAENHGLDHINYYLGSIADLSSAAIGTFDYIDCCGVLHHLADPEQGLRALVNCLNADGGIGFMLYGEFGRSGIYQLQSLLKMVGAQDLAYPDAVLLARRLIENLPPTNWLKLNPSLGTLSERSDEEIADMLLHPCDRAYTVPAIRTLLSSVGLDAVCFMPSFIYDPRRAVKDGDLRRRLVALEWWDRHAAGELLRGSIRKHCFYSKRSDQCQRELLECRPETIPIIRGQAIHQMLLDRIEGISGPIGVTAVVGTTEVTVAFADAPSSRAILALVDNKMTLGAIKAAFAPNASWIEFATHFERTFRPLHDIGQMFLSMTALDF